MVHKPVIADYLDVYSIFKQKRRELYVSPLHYLHHSNINGISPFEVEVYDVIQCLRVIKIV